MLKRWFGLSYEADGVGHNGVHSNGSTPRATAVMESPEARPPAPAAPVEPPRPAADASGFDHIYSSAAVRPPRLAYGILKVADMMSSTHLAGMSSESRRCALLMALDAAGAEIEDLLQDAVVRQRALNDYEEAQQEKLRQFEAAKVEENRAIQAELDRLTGQFMARIQANLDEVAREQDNFRAWQKRKQQEAQRITEAAAYCVPQGAPGTNGLAAVLERASAPRR
ncbi:MAG TPA: hypothetical protein VGF59_16640 [Bryobacteraceae bacterium]